MNSRLKRISAVLLAVILCSAGMADVTFAANTEGTGTQEGIQVDESESLNIDADDSIAQDTPADADCGEQLAWSIDEDGLLTIAGTGDMKGWTEDDPAPWHELADSVKEILIEDEVTIHEQLCGRYVYE